MALVRLVASSSGPQVRQEGAHSQAYTCTLGGVDVYVVRQRSVHSMPMCVALKHSFEAGVCHTEKAQLTSSEAGACCCWSEY